jgi:hypothetical protein
LGSVKGYSFSGGSKPLKPRCKAGNGFREKGKSGKTNSKGYVDHGKGTKL